KGEERDISELGVGAPNLGNLGNRDEHDCEANAGELLDKNKRKHTQIAAKSLENDTNHENNKISKLKLYQYAEGISVSNSKTVERAGRTNTDMKKATTTAKRRSKLQLEN
ncbi:unnamed protein product, partial [Porites lobata]